MSVLGHPGVGTKKESLPRMTHSPPSAHEGVSGINPPLRSGVRGLGETIVLQESSLELEATDTDSLLLPGPLPKGVGQRGRIRSAGEQKEEEKDWASARRNRGGHWPAGGRRVRRAASQAAGEAQPLRKGMGVREGAGAACSPEAQAQGDLRLFPLVTYMALSHGTSCNPRQTPPIEAGSPSPQAGFFLS